MVVGINRCIPNPDQVHTSNYVLNQFSIPTTNVSIKQQGNRDRRKKQHALTILIVCFNQRDKSYLKAKIPMIKE